MTPFPLSTELKQSIQAIRAVVFDIDGVFTNGDIIIGENGQEFKAFNALDGQGIKCLQLAGFKIAIITGRRSQAVSHRMKELNVTDVFQGIKDKLATLQNWLQTQDLTLAQTAYLGDDLPDVPCIQAVGFGVAVANAVDLVKTQADWQTNCSGGQGAVRELSECLLKNQNQWDAVCQTITTSHVKITTQ